MTWSKDDGSVADDELIYRRLLRRPSFYVPRDAISGKPIATNASFTYEEDGMSAYASGHMKRLRVEVTRLYDQATHGIAAFPAEALRGLGGGIVSVEDTDDPDVERGQCHVVCRTESPPPDKATWRLLRNELRAYIAVWSEDSREWVEPAS